MADRAEGADSPRDAADDVLFLQRVRALCARAEALGSLDALEARREFGRDEVRYALASGSLKLNGQLLLPLPPLWPGMPHSALLSGLTLAPELAANSTWTEFHYNAAQLKAMEEAAERGRQERELAVQRFDKLEREPRQNDDCRSAAEIIARLIPPLSERESEVFVFIHDNGPVTGKEIASATGIEQATLTRHFIPALKDRKLIKNRKASGYYSVAK